MTWLSALFGGGDREPDTVTAPAVVPFHVRAAQAADNLAAASRKFGRDISPAAYSNLRRIPDLIRPAIADAAEHPLLAEREYSIESLLTDLVPTTLTTFLRIPAGDRADGSDADKALTRQLDSLAVSAQDITALTKRDAVAALEANAMFLDAKLR